MAKPKHTLRQLYNLTKKHFPTRFGNAVEAKNRVSRLVFTPFIGMNSLSVRADVQGLAEKKTYKVIVVMHGVDYAEAYDVDHPLKIKVMDKQFAYMKPILETSPVQVRCSCKDYYFTFGYYNWQVGSIYGPKPKKYIRKTKTWPERNPAHAPGICKHIVVVRNKFKKTPRLD